MGALLGMKAFIIVILGGLGSIPGAIVGGIILGIIEALGGGYLSAAYKDVYAFGALVLILAVRPTGYSEKRCRVDEDPEGQRGLSGHPGAVNDCALLQSQPILLQVLIVSCLFCICTLSLNLVLGYTGQPSLAHAGFFGIGAYGVAILTRADVSFWLALPAAASFSAFVGFVIGIPTLRTRGAYFSIVTLCMGVIVTLVASNWVELTGGANGLVGIPPPGPIAVPLIGQISFQSQTGQYYMVLVFLLLTLFVMYRIVHSLRGLTFMAVRNNEALADSVGINTFATKLLSFVVADFFAVLREASMRALWAASAVGLVHGADLQLADLRPAGRCGDPGRAHHRHLFSHHPDGVSAIPAGV